MGGFVQAVLNSDWSIQKIETSHWLILGYMLIMMLMPRGQRCFRLSDGWVCAGARVQPGAKQSNPLPNDPQYRASTRSDHTINLKCTVEKSKNTVEKS